MSAKISSARRAAFLKALGATGNFSISVERAKVSRSWVTLHRGRDAAFDAACLEALEEAKARLGGAAVAGARGRARGRGDGDVAPDEPLALGVLPPGNKPPAGWGHLEGEELVVRGTRCGPLGASGRRVQIGRARLKQWTARGEKRFLTVLGETCNVKAACAAVGLTQASAYNHRKRWTAFREAWDAVLDAAETKLEWAQIECARCTLSGLPVPLDNPIREMTAGEAIYLLEMLHRRRTGHWKRWGRRHWAEPPIEKVRAEVLRKVAAMERAEAAGLRSGLGARTGRLRGKGSPGG